MEIDWLRMSSKTHLARMAGFYLAIVVFLLLLVMIFSEGLVGVFRIWFDPAIAGAHFVHGATFMTLIWIFGLAMLVQLYRPIQRVAAMQIALVIAVFALLTEGISGGDPFILVFVGPVFIAAALHPARSELLDRDAFTEGTTSPLLLALAGLALIPVVLYAVGQMNLQLTLADEHAELTHYSSMAAFGLTFVALAALAAVGGTGRRLAAYAAGVMATVLAAASLYQPTASAIDGTWSALAVLWGLAVVAAFEWSAHRTDARRDELPVEDSTHVR